MAAMKRVRVGLTGFPGAPGVSTFYFTDTATALTSLHDLYASLATAMPPDVHIQVENAGDTIESTTGALTGSWQAPPVAEVVGSGAGGYAAPVGLLLGWETETILDGHRLRGRTFIVPVGAAVFNSAGSCEPVTLGHYRDAAAAFQVSQNSSFLIWHRPYAGRAAIGRLKARPAHSGGVGLVTTSRVPAKAVVLRSRRD